MKLYNFPGSCSTAAHIALLETRLEFELVIVDLRGDRKLPDGRFLSDINPKNCLPVLELDNGEIITEVPAVLTYIGDLKPELNLMPAFGSMERLRAVEVMAFLSSEIYKTFQAYRLTADIEESHNVIKARFDTNFRFLDSILADKKYLTGDTFIVADAYLIVMLDGAPKFYNIDISSYKNVLRYIDDMGQLDSVQKARQSVLDYLGANFTRLKS